MALPRLKAASPISRAGLTWLVAGVALLLALMDGGSVAITRASVPDDARAAGYAAAEAAKGLPGSQQMAVVAYDAATRRGAAAALHVERKGFTIYPDGKVTLTVTGTAPTLVFKHLPVLRDLTVVTATTTVTALPYS